MSTLIFPLFTGLLYIIVTVWFAATAAYIATSATPIFQIFNETENGYGDTCDISQWENPDHEFFNDTNVFCGFTKYQGLKKIIQNWLRSRTLVITFVILRENTQ